MSISVLLMIMGILCIITPATQIWLSHRRLDDDAVVKWMMSLNMQQMFWIQLTVRSGVAFLFMGGALLLTGF